MAVYQGHLVANDLGFHSIQRLLHLILSMRIRPTGGPVRDSACAAGFTSRLTMLRLVEVSTMFCSFLEDLGRHCPTLEELHAERCKVQLRVVASPTLRRLAIISPLCYSTGPVAPRLEAPRFASLRLEIPYGWVYGHSHQAIVEPAVLEPPATLTDASVRLTDWNKHRPILHQLEFLKSVRSFLAVLSNVVNLHLQEFGTLASKYLKTNFVILS